MVSEAFKNTFSGFQNLLKRFKHHKERWKGGMGELSSPDKGTGNFILEDSAVIRQNNMASRPPLYFLY